MLITIHNDTRCKDGYIYVNNESEIDYKLSDINMNELVGTWYVTDQFYEQMDLDISSSDYNFNDYANR